MIHDGGGNYTARLSAGKSITIKTVNTGSKQYKLYWKSDNPDVATVIDGKIQVSSSAKKGQKALITVRTRGYKQVLYITVRVQ